MNAHLPSAPEGYSGAYFNSLVMTLRRYLGLAVSQDEETPRIILRSPNGTRYDVTVSNAGVLVVTATVKTHV
jgi:hypothetical protein